MLQPDRDSPEPPTGRYAATRTIKRLCDGDATAEPDLAAIVYADLHRMAAGLLRRERRDHTLQPTALVHEAWLRLVDQTILHGAEATLAKRKFLALAIEAMRRILIEHARTRSRQKRGGERERVPLSETGFASPPDDRELLDLDAALVELAERRPRAAKIAEMRIYGGLSSAEVAEALDVSLATAKSDWALAQALLTKWVRDRTP